MTMSTHWTNRSVSDFVYRISSDFAMQLESKMDEENISRTSFAEKIGVTPGRVSQVLNDPGNLTLRKMVEYARSLGMKVAVVAYEDGDPENKNGPINSQIFSNCWKRAGMPKDFFALQDATKMAIRTTPTFAYVSRFDFTWSESHTSDESIISYFGPNLNKFSTSNRFIIAGE